MTVDPISIAGLAIAVLDGLIKLGDRTAEILSDIRTFDDVSQELYNTVLDENTRTRLLQALLFSESSVYGGGTLFTQFDSDIQEQIELLLRRLENILRECTDILERRYNAKESIKKLKLSSQTFGASHSHPVQRKKSSPSLPTLLKWSFRDRKRVEAIIRHFEDQNARIHEKIKLWCLASQLGVNLQHLERLQNDDISIRLGFDIDATLRLAQREAEESTRSFELIHRSWDDVVKEIPPEINGGLFDTFEVDGKVMIQENHPRPDHHQDALDTRTRRKVEALAKLLHQPKEQVFRIPRCVGWKFLRKENVIAFVFEVQPKPESKPTNLLRLLNDRSIRLELGDKFRLALGLAKCVAQLHMVRWVHKSFRSENVLFFPRKSSSLDTTSTIDFAAPWILGFTASRPEDYFSAGVADFLPSRDIYRHPERQGEPQAPFTKVHDIYALGVVLLEIELWEPAITLEKSLFARAKDAYAIQAQLIKHAQRRLESRVGRRYKTAVLACLTGDFDITDDTKDDLKLQQAFRTQVVDVIETAANSI